MQIPASQQTPIEQLGMPKQSTVQEAPEHPTRILHVLSPEQLSFVVRAALVTVEAHALDPTQLTLHASPTHEIGPAHVSTAVHSMSEDFAVEMTAPVQLPAPPQPTLQLSPAHRIVLVQEPAPPHWIAHELAAWQLM